jgi:predicted metal-dependent TIM-barrel fold hydrolase
MRFFDPHIHMTSRTTDDLEAMAAAGVRAVIEPAFWVGQPRTQAGSFLDYFTSLIGWERFRAGQFGIQHYCAIGLNSKEANDRALAKEVLPLVPRFALKEGVVAVGEIGFDEITEAEEYAYRWQLEFAVEHDMVVMVHSPHRDKKRGIVRSIEIAQEIGVPMEKLVIDHNNEETVAIVETYGTERIFCDSSADWGISNPLSVPETAALMRERGIPEEHIVRATWQNALDAYAQSGQIDVEALLGEAEIDQRQTFLDNSVLRGQSPKVEARG